MLVKLHEQGRGSIVLVNPLYVMKVDQERDGSRVYLDRKQEDGRKEQLMVRESILEVEIMFEEAAKVGSL